MDRNTAEQVVSLLSEQILATLRAVASEETHPGGDADVSDQEIKDGRERVKALRKIREEYEIVATGALPL